MIDLSDVNTRALSEGVGLIGLGKMGLPMARNLLSKGFRVVGYDIAEPARTAARSIGVEVVDSPAGVSANTAMTLVVVGFDDEVTEVIEAEDTGLLATAQPGHVIAICSTVEPKTVTDASLACAPKLVHVIDAPVCRGEPAAEDASLLIMLGGDERVIEAVSSALQAIATDIYRLGGLGSGQVGKMLNNYILWATVTANYESMRLGDRLGVDLTQLREALMLSSANNWALETWTRSRPSAVGREGHANSDPARRCRSRPHATRTTGPQRDRCDQGKEELMDRWWWIDVEHGRVRS